MSPDVVLSAIYYQQPVLKPIQKPRDRYIQYYNDLYLHHKSVLDESTFMEGSQVTFSDLGESVLEVCHQEGQLTKLDLLVASYWAYEFDPEHASSGAYLCDKYKLNCKMFDVCEQGTLAPFTAIKIMHSFMSDPEINKALLLIMEQTTIPRNKNNYDLIPSATGACAIFLEKKSVLIENQYYLKMADIILESTMLQSSPDILHKLLDQYVDAKSMTDIFVRKNSYFWKLFHYFENELPDTVCIKPFSSEIGCLQPWLALRAERGNNLRDIVVFDQDVESLNAGVLVLEANKKRHYEK